MPPQNVLYLKSSAIKSTPEVLIVQPRTQGLPSWRGEKRP